MSHSDYNNNNTTYAAPAIPDVGAQRQYTNTQQHDNHLAPTHEHHNNDVHATDYGAHSGSHTPAHGQGAYPPGEPMGAQPFALSGAHHPHGVADPLAPYYPGARRANQKQVTGLGRAMPTYEEMQLKKAAEKRRREGHDAGEHHQSQHLIGAGTAQALDSIQDPNLRVVLAEILGALGGRGGISGAMTPYTMSPPLSRMPTKTGAPVNPLSRVQTVNTVAQAEDILVAIEEDRGPNPVKRAIHYIREPAAEFLGTALILLFGNGVNQQFFLSSNTGVSGLLRGTYLSVSFGWGIGVMVGVYVAGGISGAHLNPAVTLSLAVFRGFSWKKVLPYCFAQFLGAMTGSGIIYLLYNRAISIYEGGPGIRTVLDATSTAGLFTTFPLAYMGVANSFFNEFVDTAILLMVILAIGDSNNTPPPDGMNPLILLFLILGIGASLGSQTAYAINPARDLGPRFMLWMAGYGTDLWTAHHWYWIWCPFVAPLLGGLAGSFLYDLFLYKGLESPLNASWGNKQKNVQADTELAAHDSNEKSVNQHV